MEGQRPLGDVFMSQPMNNLQNCGKFCSDNNCMALFYFSTNCTCYSTVTGYANCAANEYGYIQVNDSTSTCLTVAQHQQMIKDQNYGSGDCPSGFTLTGTGDYCLSTSKVSVLEDGICE
ncbi:hypothetical protein AAVH_20118 [Aphelenchoides avenae]|nr:hypothetical protein AAVH_20118 [Aphelenchus avenae]